MNSLFFPFTAIVGMDLAKHSLIYHAIDQGLGGTVLMGHRGCAKSTMVRAFKDILVSGNSAQAPFVEVPLGASEERLLGSVDATLLVEQGKWREHKGLLEQAHGGVLYVDEVNLLPDHLVDQTLDAAASGQYRLEREGLSRQVEARFILVGTMNPEEGDLRPQLLDRFTHGVIIRDNYSAEERREIVRARMAFEDDPVTFHKEHEVGLSALKERIQNARNSVKTVKISEEQRIAVSEHAASIGLEGVRAELGVLRTARCAAAWRRDEVIREQDLEEAWMLCLAHRHVASRIPDPPPNLQDFKKPSSEIPDKKKLISSSRMTASAPRETRRDSIQLERSGNELNDSLSNWWNQPALPPKRAEKIFGSSRVLDRSFTGSRVDWPASLAASIKRGWKPGKPLLLLHRKPERRHIVWLFLDASRSAGALKFLGAALHALQSLGLRQAARRFQILLLQDGKLEWVVKRGTARAANQCFEELREAVGKSRLHQALRKLNQAVQKSGVLSGDRLMFCSDGLFTPESDGSLTDEKKRFRVLLRRLSERIPASAWLHPSPKRGMQHWIPELADSSGITLIGLK